MGEQALVGERKEALSCKNSRGERGKKKGRRKKRGEEKKGRLGTMHAGWIYAVVGPSSTMKRVLSWQGLQRGAGQRRGGSRPMRARRYGSHFNDRP